MAYEKRLCILKQIGKGFTADGMPLMGAVYAERFGKELTVTPRIAGLAPLREGRYAIAVWVNGKEYCLELKGNSSLRLPDSPSLENGFAVLICFVRNEIEAVAFGTCGNAPVQSEQLMHVFRGNSERREERKEERREERREEPTAPPQPQTPPQYDDEAISSDDYFEYHTPQEEARPVRKLTYYYTVRAQLEKTMKDNPPDDRLCTTIPHSEWVNTGRGLVGIAYREGIPRYLCVAVEANVTPPPEMKSVCVFVPSSHYSDDTGFYVVFQDAETGEYVCFCD